MGAITKIQWCHHTMNFWLGCTEVSSACDFCYAKMWAKRAGRPELWQGDRQRTTAENWKQPYKWNAAAYKTGDLTRVFVNSLSDFFDNQVDEEWRYDATRVIIDCTDLQWLLLTKRPQNIAKLWPSAAIKPDPWLPHVWLGTTVENPEEARKRIPHLVTIPAVVRFLSMEPLLEATNIQSWLYRIDWVIIGGESGAADRRPFDTFWAKALIDQCSNANVPVFVKQLGSHVVHNGKRLWLKDKKGGDIDEWPEELRVRQFPRVRVPA